MVPLIQQVRKVMKDNGVGEKALWNTEAGWLDSQPLPDEVAAAFVARAYILNWAAGVDLGCRRIINKQHGTQIELTRPDNATLTPSGKGYITVQEWLTGATLKRCARSSGQSWSCDMDKSGATAHLVWSTEGQVTFSVPNEWQAKEITKLTGEHRSLGGNTVQVGIQPVLIQ
jgi:hypothetical protein